MGINTPSGTFQLRVRFGAGEIHLLSKDARVVKEIAVKKTADRRHESI
jgi:hypothetical protein